MKTRPWAFFGLIIAGGSLFIVSQTIDAGVIDAVSGATIQIKGGTTTDTSATITWTDGYPPSDGTQTFYLDSLSNSSTSKMKFSVRVPSSLKAVSRLYTWPIPRTLAPSTTYFYVMYQNSPGNGSATTKGSFKTDPKGKPSAILLKAGPMRPQEMGFDALGHRLSHLPHGTVTEFNKDGGALFDPAR